MSTALGGANPISPAGKPANPNPISTPGSPAAAYGGVPAADYVTGILSREMKPAEIREFSPRDFREFDPQEIRVCRPEPLDQPEPDKVKIRSFDTVEYRSLARVEAREVERLDIRQFDFPDPAELRPRELKDFSRPSVEGPEMAAIEASELKPALRFEDLFFQPRDYIQPEPFEPAEIETIKAEPYRGQTAQYLDVADPDTYNNEARGPKLHPRAAQAYQDRDRVIHKYSHQAMSHWHYHYQAVPADDVPAPRDRSVHLR